MGPVLIPQQRQEKHRYKCRKLLNWISKTKSNLIDIKDQTIPWLPSVLYIYEIKYENMSLYIAIGVYFWPNAMLTEQSFKII